MYTVGELQSWQQRLADDCQRWALALHAAMLEQIQGIRLVYDLSLEQRLRCLAELIEPLASLNALTRRVQQTTTRIINLSGADYVPESQAIARELSQVECQLGVLES